MDTADQIYELVKTLPEAQAGEVLDFVEFLRYELQQGADVPSEAELLPLPVLEGFVPEGWRDAVS